MTRLMNQLDRFVVEEELLVVTEEGVGRPRGERPRRRFPDGALMRLRTFSCARMWAVSSPSPELPGAFPPSDRPAAAISSLAPV